MAGAETEEKSQSTGSITEQINSFFSTSSESENVEEEQQVEKPRKSIEAAVSSLTHIKTVKSELILKEKTPWMQDLELQVERILAILEKAIIKLKIMILIPKLVDNDCEMLLKYLTKEKAEFVNSIVDKYLTDESGTEMIEHLYIPYLKEKKEKLDPQMTNILAILYNCEGIRDAAQTYTDPNFDQTTNLIIYLEKLKDTIKIKLNISAEEEALREQELYRAFHANEVCRAEIEKLQNQVEAQHEELGNLLKAKEDLIVQYQEKLNTVQENFKYTIIKKVNESEKKMVKESMASEVRRIDLEAEAKKSVANYELMLEQNLAEEKQMRAKRTKVETQLATWLAKFDAEIGERNAEFEAVQADYDEEKAAFDALQEKMDEQDIQYRVLMRERDEEEKKQFEIKALAFLRNRSARIIQRAWKAYKERKELRKKKRKAAAARKAKKIQEKLEKAVSQMKKRAPGSASPSMASMADEKEKKPKKGKEKPKIIVEEEEDEAVSAIPKTKSEEIEGEGEGQGPEKKKKEKKKKDKKKKGKNENTLPKGEIPKNKKDINITAKDDAVAMLEGAFGGQLEGLDTTTQFTKEEVKVDLAQL